MTDHSKQLSNPFSTGGGGTIFETRVQAYFVTMMLCGGFAPCLPPWPIKKIKLQGKYEGYDTDDAIVFVESPDGNKERKLLCQIKHSISVTRSNKLFGGVIKAAWNDFNNPKIFTKGKDLIALVTGPLNSTDVNDVRTILEWARSENGATEFLNKVNITMFSSKKKMTKLNAFRVHLKNANGGDISDDDFWHFMKSFHLLGYDLDVESGVILSLLQSLIGQYSPGNVHGLWTQIINEVQSANQNAGTITIESLPEELQNVFKKPGVETIPTELGIKPSTVVTTNWDNVVELAIANLLGGWDENV
jgi:hypothetical protein